MAKKQKAIRKFNGKYYVRIFTGKNETIAQRVKNNTRGQGFNALIIQSGENYQVWSTKRERQHNKTYGERLL